MLRMLVLAITLLFSSASADPPLVPSQCESSAWSNGGCVLVCPGGDGTTLASVGATIHLEMVSENGTPVPGVPTDAYYLRTPDYPARPCSWGLPFEAGHIPLLAGNMTDHMGEATIIGTIPAMYGGYANSIVVAFTPDGASVVPFRCGRYDIHCCPADLAVLPIKLRSPDFNGDGCVNLFDTAIFGDAYPSPPKPFNPLCDLNGDGVVNLPDFARFYAHINHKCANIGDCEPAEGRPVSVDSNSWGRIKSLYR